MRSPHYMFNLKKKRYIHLIFNLFMCFILQIVTDTIESIHLANISCHHEINCLNHYLPFMLGNYVFQWIALDLHLYQPFSMKDAIQTVGWNIQYRCILIFMDLSFLNHFTRDRCQVISCSSGWHQSLIIRRLYFIIWIWIKEIKLWFKERKWLRKSVNKSVTVNKNAILESISPNVHQCNAQIQGGKGSLHVVWQVSFGCWITWFISIADKNFIRVSSFPKLSDGYF